jgi:mono/diheme cytochrome c family protein
MSSFPRRAFAVAGALLALAAFTWAGSSGASNGETGAHLYRIYCVACHGAEGRGDGALAGSLRTRPSDLTVLARNNQGAFPFELVHRIVDGRQKVPGHGGGDMPAWGDAFARSRDGSDEAAIAKKIELLVHHVASLQRSAGQGSVTLDLSAPPAR